ncbi:MAG TPA: hypothetical protein VKV57_12170 [bacterium]|nr:hypothetical protein [bacterium]
MANGRWSDAVDLIVLGNRPKSELREWDEVGKRAADAARLAVGAEDIFTFERGVMAILGVLGETRTFSPFYLEFPDPPANLVEEQEWWFRGMRAVFTMLLSLMDNGKSGSPRT